MFFLFEERRNWVRTTTHTTIRDRDPGFEQWAARSDGAVATRLGVWLCEWRGTDAYPLSYLGSVRLETCERRDVCAARLVSRVRPELPPRTRRPLERLLRRQLYRFSGQAGQAPVETPQRSR